MNYYYLINGLRFLVHEFFEFQAVVTMKNFQMCRPIKSPGWTLEWTWSKNEVILSMVGAQTTDQGNCSKFGYNIPHSCKRNPEIVDLLPNVPFNQQRAKPRLAFWHRMERTLLLLFLHFR